MRRGSCASGRGRGGLRSRPHSPPRGWAISSGDYGGVGVGGIATAGGIGFLGREHGLTIDHVRAVELVLADGGAVRASAEDNPDLFWAARGAGGNVGVATAFEFVAEEVGDVGWVQLAFDASDLEAFLEGWGRAQKAAPREVTTFVIVSRPVPGQPTIAQLYGVIDQAEPDTIIERLQPFADLAPLVQQQVQVTSYAAVMNNVQPGPHRGQGEPIARSGLLRRLTPEVVADLSRFLREGSAPFFQLRAVGGAIADVPAEATAYAHRDAAVSIAALGTSRAGLDAAWDRFVHPHLEGLYVSFESDPRPERIDDAFPPATLERLRVIKARYDPTGLFRDNFPLG